MLTRRSVRPGSRRLAGSEDYLFWPPLRWSAPYAAPFHTDVFPPLFPRPIAADEGRDRGQKEDRQVHATEHAEEAAEVCRLLWSFKAGSPASKVHALLLATDVKGSTKETTHRQRRQGCRARTPSCHHGQSRRPWQASNLGVQELTPSSLLTRTCKKSCTQKSPWRRGF